MRAVRDRKLREQIEAAVHAIDEGTAALASGRKKPKRTGRNVVLGAIGVAPPEPPPSWRATNPRNQVFGSAKALGDEITGAEEAGDDTAVPSPS